MTISGGEPLVQPAFTEALLRGCKAMGLHTALDTSGFAGDRAPDSLLDVTDLVLLDIKSGLPGLYQRVTGVPLQPTLDFAQRLKARGLPVWVRFVLVPGLTDGEDNIRAVARIVAGLSNVERVEVLPFHKMGEHKWEEMGMTYRLKDTPPPTAEQTERAGPSSASTASPMCSRVTRRPAPSRQNPGSHPAATTVAGHPSENANPR